MSLQKKPFTLFDKLDYRIIKLLQQDSRRSAKSIAEELDVNDRTVRKRIDRMIDMGVGRFVLILNPEIFGYSISVDIFLEIDLNNEEAIVKQLLAMPHISYLAFGQETNELSIEARYQNSEQLYDFLWKIIPSIEGVKVIKYALVPRILRNIDAWTPSEDDFND